MTTQEQNTRDKIIQTAFGLFMKNGYENTSIQSIIDAVGIAKGTYYHHFVSKDDMLEEVMDGIVKKALAAADEIDKRTDLNAIEKLNEVVRFAATIKLERFYESVIMVRQMQVNGNERIRSYIQKAAQNTLAPVYTRFLSQAVDEGLLDLEFPEETSQLIAAMGIGISDRLIAQMLAAIDGDDDALDALIRLSRSYERALKAMIGIKSDDFHLYDEALLIQAIKSVRSAVRADAAAQ